MRCRCWSRRQGLRKISRPPYGPLRSAKKFWQSPRTRRQARPDVRLPTARAAGVAELEIIVDARERYAYTFAGQQVRTVTRGLACGDYAITVAGELVAAVERKSLS